MIDVSLHQIIQSPDDPNVECQSYDATNGYFDCVTEKLEKAFVELITCVPPWFTDDQEKVCQQDDIQEAISFAKKQGYVDKMTGKKVQFSNNIFHIVDFPGALLNSHYLVCPKPCKTLGTTATKRLQVKDRPHALRNLVLNFKPMVEVQRSIQKKSVLDVITDIGGSMGPELHRIVD